MRSARTDACPVPVAAALSALRWRVRVRVRTLSLTLSVRCLRRHDLRGAWARARDLDLLQAAADRAEYVAHVAAVVEGCTCG